MPEAQTARQVLDRQFLEMRSRLLDLAAARDRIARHPGAVAAMDDPRISQLRRGIEALLSDEPNCAERIQLIFSDSYDPAWREGQQA